MASLCPALRSDGKRCCCYGKLEFMTKRAVGDEDDLSDVLSAVGPRLRALRKESDTTLADLSATTGISVSTLSRLESGQRRPNLELLLPLAKAYRVPLDELVGAPPTADPRIHPHPVLRNGITMLPLTRRVGGLQAYKQIIPARGDEPDTQSHEGYEWLYVLNGRLRLVLGERDLIMTPGEAAEFDTRVPHWTTSVGPGPVEVLALFSRQGERVHLRARST
jgi:transcriptional regulator with XRE-family HTH domain